MEVLNGLPKMLVLAPHPDDEINLAGGIIYGSKVEYDIYVAYVTEGNYLVSSEIRHREAEAALSVLGVKNENIIYLGFNDCSYDAEEHTYHLEGSAVTGSIYELLKRISADVIICSDLDYHPDHIMCSLCFERALGKLLKERPDYSPEVLKTFAYENSYNGPGDFFEGNKPEFRVNSDGLLISNPYYRLTDAVFYGNTRECNSYHLGKNPLWRAVLCHKSQVLAEKAKRIINSGYLLWARRTDTLLRNANITVSSGDAGFLNDFMLCDSGNILGGHISPVVFDKGFWTPSRDDAKREITVSLEETADSPVLRIYPAMVTGHQDEGEITVVYGGREEDTRLALPYTDIALDGEVKQFSIIAGNSITGISEIELFKDGQPQEPVFAGKADAADIPGRAPLFLKVMDNIVITAHEIAQKANRKIRQKNQKSVIIS